MGMDAGICRHILAAAGLLGIRCAHALGDAEPFCIEPGHLPHSLRRAPDGAEALGALAQQAIAVALLQLLGAVLSRPEREAGLHAGENGQGGRTVDGW